MLLNGWNHFRVNLYYILHITTQNSILLYLENINKNKILRFILYCGYMIPLSIESGLINMHSIRIPTDIDLQQYPHVFFTLPDTWDASVLDHGITPSLLEEINQESDDSLLQDSIFNEFGEVQRRVVQQLNIFWDSNPTESGEHAFHTHLHESNHADQDWNH